MSILKDLLELSKSEQVVESHEEVDASIVEELEEHFEQLSKIMEEVQQLVRHLPRSERALAESYWIPHIMIALGGEHRWMTAGHEATMKKTIDELKSQMSHDDNEDEDDEYARIDR